MEISTALCTHVAQEKLHFFTNNNSVYKHKQICLQKFMDQSLCWYNKLKNTIVYAEGEWLGCSLETAYVRPHMTYNVLVGR